MMKNLSSSRIAAILLIPLTFILMSCQAQPVPSRSLEAHEAQQSQAPPIQQAPYVPSSRGYHGYRHY